MNENNDLLKDVEKEVDRLVAPFASIKKGPSNELTKTYLKALYMYELESGRHVTYSSAADLVGTINSSRIEALERSAGRSIAAELYNDFLHHNEYYQLEAMIEALTVLKNAEYDHTFRKLSA